MGIIGQKIKDNMAHAAYLKYIEYVATVNTGKNPGDDGYIVADPNMGNPSNNPYVDIRFTDAIGDAVEDAVGIIHRNIVTPVWDTTDPITTTIKELETNLFKPTITLNWQPTPPLDTWDSSVTYLKKDEKTYNGTDYISLQDNNINHLPDETNSLWWEKLDNSVLEVRVFRQKDSGVFVHIASIAAPGETYEDTDVLFNSTYSYQLIRFDPNYNYSDFSTTQSIATATFPIPSTPFTPPILTVSPGAIGVQIEQVPNDSAVIDHYIIEYKEADADSTNDGFYSVPIYPLWSTYTVLVSTKSTQIIHNGALPNKVYKYKYKAVSDKSIDSLYSPESISVIPFPKTNIEETSLSYFSDMFHLSVPANGQKSIIYSPLSIDPNKDTDITLNDLDLWWQTDTGKVWEYNLATTSWDSTPVNDINILSVIDYNALIINTITSNVKTTDILPNYKKIIFRKIILERFASKIIQSLQSFPGYISYIDSYTALLDTYYNSLYGLLSNDTVDTTNHNIVTVKETYLNFITSEKEFLSSIYKAYIKTKTNSDFNSNYTFSFDNLINNTRFLIYTVNHNHFKIYYGTTNNKTTVESSAVDYDLYLDTEVFTISYFNTSWVDITSTSDINLFYLVPSGGNALKTVNYFNSSGTTPTTYSISDILITDTETTIVEDYSKTFLAYTLYSSILNQASGFLIDEWVNTLDKVDDSSTLRIQTLRHNLQNNYKIGDILDPVADIDYIPGSYSSVTFIQNTIYICILDFLTEFNPNNWSSLLKANDKTSSTSVSNVISVVINSGDTLTPIEKIQTDQDWVNIKNTYDDLSNQASVYVSNFPYVQDALNVTLDTKNQLYSYLFGDSGIISDLTTTTIRTGLYSNLTNLISNFNLAKDTLIKKISTARTQYEALSGFDGTIDGVDVISPNTPSAVSNVKAIAGLNSLKITWDNASNLTNLGHYEIQASEDQTNWYSLDIDPVSKFSDTLLTWKNVIGSYTTVVDNSAFINNIVGKSSAGYSVPTEGRTLYFRVRIITKLNTQGTYSSIISGISEITRVADVSFAVQRSLAIDGTYSVIDISEIDGIPVSAVNGGVWADSFMNEAKTIDGLELVDYKIVNVLDSEGTVVYQTYEEDFIDGDIIGRWHQEGGFFPQVYQSMKSGDALAGGYFLRIGDNVDNDESTLVWKKSIPFEPSKLYRIRARIRKYAGTANTVSIGVIGRDFNDSVFINTVGANLVTDAFLVSAKNELPADSNWYEYIGYIGATYDLTDPQNPVLVLGNTKTPDGLVHLKPESPESFYTGVKYFRPILVFNENGTNGIYDIDYFQVEEIDPKTAYQLSIWSYSVRPFEIDGDFVSGVMKSQNLPDLNYWDLELGNFSVGLNSSSYFKVINAITANEPNSGLFIRGLDIELTSADLRTFFTIGSTQYAFSHAAGGMYWGYSDVTPVNFLGRVEWEPGTNDLVIEAPDYIDPDDNTTNIKGNIRLRTNGVDSVVISPDGELAVDAGVVIVASTSVKVENGDTIDGGLANTNYLYEITIDGGGAL